MKKIIEQLEEAVSGMFHSESSGHDIAHLSGIAAQAEVDFARGMGFQLVAWNLTPFVQFLPGNYAHTFFLYSPVG